MYSVSLENDNGAMGVDLESNPKVTKYKMGFKDCRWVHQHKQGSESRWTLDIHTQDNKITGSHINTQPRRGEGESLTPQQKDWIFEELT